MNTKLIIRGVSNHLNILFKAGECGFEEDCVLDIDGGFYSHIEQNKLENNTAIEIKYEITRIDILQRIYKLVNDSKYISTMIKLDIYTSFNLYGITGLKRPK